MLSKISETTYDHINPYSPPPLVLFLASTQPSSASNKSTKTIIC